MSDEVIKVPTVATVVTMPHINRHARIAKIRGEVIAHMPVKDSDVLWLIEELETLQRERFQMYFDVERVLKQIDAIVDPLREFQK
jgi:hypothetical protein